MSHTKKKRGLSFSSRAHLFKENLLDAFKGGGGVHHAAGLVRGHQQHHRKSSEKSSITLARKASGSTDNLAGHLGAGMKNTDCLVKEVQFSLKYFQDVVSKQTYYMLPGCATVVLETVWSMQVGVVRSQWAVPSYVRMFKC